MAAFDDELDPGAIGRRLHRHRVRAGLTRAQLAAQVGRSPSWIARAERGELRLDRLSMLQQLARALGVPLGELVGVRAWGGGRRSRDVARALRTQGAVTVRVAGAHLEAARRALALALMGMILAVAWVIAHLGRLSSSATIHHRRSAFLTVSAVLISTALIATVTIGFGGVSLSRSPYNEVPFTTPTPAANLKPATKTPARQPAPVASVPLAQLPVAPPAPAPATPVVAPAATSPDRATPRVAAVPAPVAPITAAVTGVVKPVSQTLGQTVGAVTGAVKPVTQTLGAVVHATQPVTHVVTSVGSALGMRGSGLGALTALGGLTAAQHQQSNVQGFPRPLRSLIGSWTQAFTHPFASGGGSSGAGNIVRNLGDGWFLP